LFTGQALKAKVKNANEDWLRFFALTSAAFARKEKTAAVPATPDNQNDLVRELKEIVERERIIACLLGWNNTIHHIEETARKDALAFLMVLDPTQTTLRVWSFAKAQLAEAQEKYKQQEKETESDPRIQVVLVSVDSVRALPKAYPNYYVDTKDFVNAVQRELETVKK
jgi:hypothetical protein